MYFGKYTCVLHDITGNVMEGKWTADLATLLRINKGVRILISIKGNDNSSGIYQHAITSHFAQTPTNFKRSAVVKFVPLTFPLKFVPYEETLIFSPQLETGFVSTAFIHLFFISCASVDEYRTSVRHNVSEWFATLSNRSDTQWFIVVDTTRAKEKKNRTTLMDRLKSDFSKHQHKLIEVSESVEHGTFASLVQTLQSSLTSHLELLLDTWERHLKTLKEQKSTDSWNLVDYMNENMDHARLYWSLGALENALKLYDELDAFLFHALLSASTAPSPDWTHSLAASLPVCPSLSSTMAVNRIEADYRSLIGVRHILLSQQLLLTLCIYQQRLRAPAGVAPSIRVDFAAIILKYAHHCVQSVMEHGTLHSLLPCPHRLSVWVVFLVGEVLSLCGLLADPSTVDGAAHAACHLNIVRFDAILKLSELCGNDEKRKDIVAWIGKMDPFLTDSLKSETVFFPQIQKVHDVTAALLTQFGRNRLSAAQDGKLAEYMNAHGRVDANLPYELRLVLSLLEGGSTGAATSEAIRRIIPKLHEKEDAERLFGFHLFLSLHACTTEQKDAAFEELKVLLGQHATMKMRPPPSIPSPFSIHIDHVGMQILVPGDCLTVSLSVHSQFAHSLVDVVRVRVHLRHINTPMLDRRKEPAFEVGYNKTEQKAFMTCVHPDRDRRGEKEKISTNGTPIRELVFESPSPCTLSTGENRLMLVAHAVEKGFYMLEEVTVSIFEEAAVFTIPVSDISTRDHPLALIVQKTPNKLDVQMPEQLVAGVAQRVTISLEAGAKHTAPSTLTVYAKESHLEFLNTSGVWTSSVECPVPAMEKGERCPVKIEMCRVLDGRSVTNLDKFSEKIFIEWQEQTWPLDLQFHPLFVLKSSTTQLEAQCLLEAELSRPLPSDWLLELQEATLEYSDAPVEEKGAPVVELHKAKSLLHALPEVSPSEVVGLVWMLGAGSDAMLRCKLTMRYAVKPVSPDAPPFVHREYVFEDWMHVNAPKVEYELCAQMLSQQPGAQLCRAGTPCDMVISIRSLTYRIESLYVVLDADDHMWNLQERAKIVQMKESGLGQIAFTVVPSSAGFLPYPVVNVFSAQANQLRSGDGFWSDAVEYTTGKCLVSFLRTAGKQIRVLGGMNERVGQGEREQTTKGGGLREKLGKLFD